MGKEDESVADPLYQAISDLAEKSWLAYIETVKRKAQNSPEARAFLSSPMDMKAARNFYRLGFMSSTLNLDWTKEGG